MRKLALTAALTLAAILMVAAFNDLASGARIVKSNDSGGAAKGSLPDRDPAARGSVDIIPALRKVHPRLLFTADEAARLRKPDNPEARTFLNQMTGYAGGATPPTNTAFLTDATDAQRQGAWKLPSAAITYALTGDKRAFENTVNFMKKFLELEHWETGEETDSGMGAANIMVGAAIAYDCTYNALPADFREQFRSKLLLQARRMYYLGHLNGNHATAYWQGDAQNNHRWHRDAGLVLSVLAVADAGRTDDDWLLEKTAEELKFVADWLPDDGSNHESPSYMSFGTPYLILAFDAADRCLGTRFMKGPFFKNAPLFRLHTLTPGLQETFCYGDSGGTGFINAEMFKCAAVSREADLQAGLLDFYGRSSRSFGYGWFSLVWYDGSLKGGSIDNLAKNHLFPDLGIAFMRDGWKADNVGMMFKCGPAGGYKLNDWRNKGHYINVAHDDPDANMFVIYADGATLADDDRYAYKKLTASHNTILVNGKGQKIEPRDGHWLQPADTDMTKMANIVTWKTQGDLTVVEGEAGGSYDDLRRFRRAMIWVPKGYVLMIDDIRARRDADLTWLVQGPDLETVDADKDVYRIKNGKSACEFRVFSGSAKADIVRSTADNRDQNLGYKQLQLKKRASTWQLVTLFNAWNHKGINVDLKPLGEAVQITVKGPDFTDTWQWSPAANETSPAQFRGERKGVFKVDVGSRDRAALPTQRAN